MTAATWVTMIAVTGLVWGGFAWALQMALREESRKRHGPGDAHPGHEKAVEEAEGPPLGRQGPDS